MNRQYAERLQEKRRHGTEFRDGSGGSSWERSLMQVGLRMGRAGMLLAALGMAACSRSQCATPRTVVSEFRGRSHADVFGGRVRTARAPKEAFPVRFDFHRGERLRFNLFIEGNVLMSSNDGSPVVVDVVRDFSMIAFLDREPVFSFDGIHWKGVDAWTLLVRAGAEESDRQGTTPSIGIVVERAPPTFPRSVLGPD